MNARSLITAGVMLALSAGGALAQAAAPSSPAPAAAPAPAGGSMGKKPRTAQSIQCSSKATAQNLHGKPRKQFMKSCKAGKA